MFELDMQKPKNFGGIGSFSTKNVFKRNKTLFVGECAGLQDLLGGFGIRYAITSGFLAAKSIIDNEDYERVAKKQFEHKLKASLVNRFLWERFGNGAYSLLIDRIKGVKNPFKFLYSAYDYNRMQKLIYPVAIMYMKKKYPQLRL